MKSEYRKLESLLDMIEEPNQTTCRKLLDENQEIFLIARGSSHNHQAWEGGYLDHITEIMNIAVLLYPALNSARPLPFSLSDSLLVLFLHDLEKPWRFRKKSNGEWESVPGLADKEKQVWPFVQQKIKEYGFVLTEDHWNGIQYVEGEKSDYSQKKRAQTPLAAFAHMCDVWSARGWFNYPLKFNDPWFGNQP